MRDMTGGDEEFSYENSSCEKSSYEDFSAGVRHG
ncbi:MAG: hypothetical protein RIR62_1658, partial [Pseudomonadota bacterium]